MTLLRFAKCYAKKLGHEGQCIAVSIAVGVAVGIAVGAATYSIAMWTASGWVPRLWRWEGSLGSRSERKPLNSPRQFFSLAEDKCLPNC